MDLLRYNDGLEAHELNISEAQRRGAPVITGDWDTRTISRDWEGNIHNYCGVDPTVKPGPHA